MKKFNVAAIAIFALGVGLIAGPAISASQSNVINACVNKSTGLLRIAKKCTKAEKPLSWNKQGLPGEQGLPGMPGQTGSTFNYGLSPIGSLNCFQKVIQADNSGFIWNKNVDRAKFESQTGCTVSDVDLNPNSQLASFYRDWEQAQVVSSKILALEFTSGGETTGNGQALYEVTVNNPTERALCSTSTGYRPSLARSAALNRVFENPTTGKTYAIGQITTNQFRTKSLITVGLGEPTDIVTWYENEDNQPFYVSGNEDATFVFESMVRSMPKNSTATLKLVSVLDGAGEEWNFSTSNAEVTISGGALARVERIEDEDGYLAVYQISTNELENGESDLTMRLTQGDDFELQAYQSFSVGVSNCFSYGEYDVHGEPLETISNSRLVIESYALPEKYPSEEARRVGWVWGSWFE